MDAASVVSKFQKLNGILQLLTVFQLTSYQWPKPACVKDGAKFDFIIVGGGTAGCVIANRLIETGNASVLLIEAGGVPPLESDVPGLLLFLKNSKYDWNFTSICDDANEYHKNDVIQISQGKMLGGSGSMSYMGYVRGTPYDYDQWAAITNDSSWSWDSVLPIFCKNEKLIDEKILESHKPHFYGTKGKIELAKQYYPRNNDYFEAFKEMGYDSHLDVNPNFPLGFTNVMFNIGDNIRQSTAIKFLSPIKNNPKLSVLLNTLVTKINFDNQKTAVGVEVITEDNKIMTFRANKEVIVSAGTIKSPQLLMLSGIGPKDHLKNKGIDVLADLPVGKNFQDHVNSIIAYKMTNSSLASNNKNPYKYPFAIMDGYVALNKCQSYPDYEIIGLHIGDGVTILGTCAFYFKYDNNICDAIYRKADNKEIFLVFVTYLNPKSRGEILLSTTDPMDSPIIIPGYYTNDEDIENHAKYILDFNRVLKTKFFKQLGAELVNPNLERCAGLKEGTMDYWRCYVVSLSDTAHYFVGTCAMGSVLDSRLRVRGVKNLRVADASIMPVNVRSLTYANVVMIAQKASDMIIEQHGLN